MERAMPSDYPVLFWLTKLLRPGMRIFDFGGHVGVAYHCFSKYLDYPPDLEWTVCDVPAVIAEGAAIAKQRSTPGKISFTSRFEDAEGCDLLLAAGTRLGPASFAGTGAGR
jgi:putative methyltransferase (TIGR04325 family)